MKTGKYEQMTYENIEDINQSKGGSTVVGLDKVLKMTKKKQSLKGIFILLSFIVLIVILLIILLIQSAKLSKLKAYQSDLEYTAKSLKLQENRSQDIYNKLNEEKEQLNQKAARLDLEIWKYQTKASKPNEASAKVNEQLKALETEYNTTNDEVKKLQAVNDEARKRISDLEDQSFTFSTEIADLNQRILNLKALIQEKYGSDALDPMNFSIESKIIHSPKEEDFIKKELPSAKFKLLYRKSRDGFDPAVFHMKCDAAKATLVILQINYYSEFRYVIGGYTGKSWDTTKLRVTVKGDQDAFLFNLSAEAIYRIANDEEAIICDNNEFAVFNKDLAIGLTEIKSSFPYAYGNKNSLMLGLTCGFDSLSSAVIGEMEVFEVVKIS